MRVTNRERAHWAQQAVDVFREQTGTDKEDAIADLVADLCHLARRYRQDPLEQVKRGLRMFADERDYPPDGWAPQDKLANVDIIFSRGDGDWMKSACEDEDYANNE